MDALRALVFQPLVKENEALGTRLVFATNNILLMRNSNQTLVVVALVRRKTIDFCQQRALTASTKKLKTNSVIE